MCIRDSRDLVELPLVEEQLAHLRVAAQVEDLARGDVDLLLSLIHI